MICQKGKHQVTSDRSKYHRNTVQKLPFQPCFCSLQPVLGGGPSANLSPTPFLSGLCLSFFNGDHSSTTKWCYFYLGLFADTTSSCKESNRQKQVIQVFHVTSFSIFKQPWCTTEMLQHIYPLIEVN